MLSTAHPKIDWKTEWMNWKTTWHRRRKSSSWKTVLLLRSRLLAWTKKISYSWCVAVSPIITVCIMVVQWKICCKLANGFERSYVLMWVYYHDLKWSSSGYHWQHRNIIYSFSFVTCFIKTVRVEISLKARLSVFITALEIFELHYRNWKTVVDEAHASLRWNNETWEHEVTFSLSFIQWLTSFQEKRLFERLDNTFTNCCVYAPYLIVVVIFDHRNACKWQQLV